jgi:predicted nucleic acid-binding protein
MIAADTSSLSAYLRGEAGSDVDRLSVAVDSGQLALPPVVVTEILSATSLVPSHLLSSVATLDVVEGYWERAGEMRRKLKLQGLRAKVADALIAQSCIDHGVPLITRDTDFRHFEAHCGLKLA